MQKKSFLLKKKTLYTSFQRYLKTNNLQLIACKSVCKTLTVSQWIVKIEIRHRYHTLLLKAKGVKWITTSRQLPYKDITISPSFYGFTRVVVRECRLMLLCYLDQDFAVITISISTTTRHPMTSAVYGYNRYCPSLVGGKRITRDRCLQSDRNLLYASCSSLRKWPIHLLRKSDTDWQKTWKI